MVEKRITDRMIKIEIAQTMAAKLKRKKKPHGKTPTDMIANIE